MKILAFQRRNQVQVHIKNYSILTKNVIAIQQMDTVMQTASMMRQEVCLAGMRPKLTAQ